MRDRWDDIGDELNIDTDIASKIRSHNNNEPAACLIELIKEWLKSLSHPRTWETLAHVLRSSTLNKMELAEEGKCKFTCS